MSSIQFPMTMESLKDLSVDDDDLDYTVYHDYGYKILYEIFKNKKINEKAMRTFPVIILYTMVTRNFEWEFGCGGLTGYLENTEGKDLKLLIEGYEYFHFEQEKTFCVKLLPFIKKGATIVEILEQNEAMIEQLEQEWIDTLLEQQESRRAQYLRQHLDELHQAMGTVASMLREHFRKKLA